MTTCSTTHHDISFEPADSLQDDLDQAATAYRGRHVRLDVPCAEQPQAPDAPVSGSHPRRRGFGILSRLARVDSDSDSDTEAGELAVPTGAHAALVDA